MSTTLTQETVVTEMARPEGKKALLLVMDGLGGYRTVERGSELTEANTPNLDRLAGEGSLGLHDPVTRGITPGSGAGHLGLFGYDPLEYEIGRGALSAAGIGFELQPGDVAARVNFCTLDPDGTIADRRAGRLPTEEAAGICDLLMREITLDGAEFFLEPEREHRGLLVLRGQGLDKDLTDTDPQVTGVPPLDPQARTPEAKGTEQLVRQLLDQARSLLADRQRGNFLLLRGFDTHKELPSFPERYRVDALAIAMGTSHGAYKFTRKPDGAILAMHVIEEIHAKLPNMHLVMHGSSSVPQDLQDIAPDILRHRLVLSYDALADDVPADRIIGRIMATVPMPRSHASM